MKQKLLLLLACIGLSIPIKAADDIRFDNYELHLTFMLNETTKEATVGTGQEGQANAVLYPDYDDPWWNFEERPNLWNVIDIPNTIVYNDETYTITAIAPYAFYRLAGLQQVNFPETVRSIGTGAFKYCVHLETVNIPYGISEISPEAFMLCRKLKTVELPKSVVNIGESAFGDCDGLESITIPGNCKSVGDDAFRWCKKLHKVIFENGEDTLRLGCGRKISILYESRDYMNEDGFTEDDLRDHPRGLFADCELDTIYLGRDITYPFEKEWRSIHVPVPAGYDIQMPTIHLNPFVQSSKYDITKNCYYDNFFSLKLLEFGEGLTDIPDRLFEITVIYNEITFPKSLRRIGNMAFCNGRTGTKELTIPENVEYIGSYAFGHIVNYSRGFTGTTELSKLTFLSNRLTYIGRNAFDIINVEELEIPSSVKSMDKPFYNSEKLRCVKCYPAVPPTGGNPFGEVSLYVPSGSGTSYRQQWPDCHIIDPNDEWVTVNVKTAGSLYSRLLAQDLQASGVYKLKLKGQLNENDISVINTMNNLYALDMSGLTMTELPQNLISNKRLITSLTLPNVLERINDREFEGFINLGGTIEIPNSCVTIGDYAFYDTYIEQLIYTGAKAFGEGAFQQCKKLRDVNITQGTIVGNDCFIGTDIQKIRIGSGAQIGQYAFSDCSLSEVTLEDGVSSVGSEAFSPSRVVFEGSVENIGEHAFGDPAEVAVPDVLTWCNLPFPDEGPISTASRLLVNNEEITEIVIPDNVRQIRNNLFNSCTQIESVVIPSGVTTIGEKAFADCENLNVVQIPNTINAINDWAFYNCKQLQNISLPNSIETIGNHVFQNCESIESIDWPQKLENIGYASFSGCANLAEIKLGKVINSIDDEAFANCTSLANIDIPNSVTSLGTMAFSACTNLQKVIVHWDNPFKLKEGIFTSIPSTCYLHIPIMTSNKYLEKGWKDVFPNLKESGVMVLTAKTGGTVIYGSDVVSNGTKEFLFNPFKSFILNIVPQNGFSVKKVKINGENVTEQIEDNKLLIDEPDENLDVFVVFADDNVSIGDVNGDGIVNVTDAIAIVNYILKKNPEEFLEFASDMNDDDIVNVTDAVMVINQILRNTNNSSRLHIPEFIPQ